MDRDQSIGDGGARPTGEATYPGCEIEEDELEFLRAVDAYKVRHCKKFLSNTELLAILKGLGYRKGQT